MSTETKESTEFQWMRVREAITQRWPSINRDELADCPNETCKLTDFVKQNVDANDDEVESVINEFAPHESLTERVAHAASDTLHQAGESAQFAYMRADECIAKRPTESVLTSFVAGIALGATVTALWMRSKPQPTVWDRVKDRHWS